MADLVDVTWHGKTAVVTLNRPEKRNAMHAAMWKAIGAAGTAVRNASPRAVVLTGAGGHFSAGMDLSPDNALMMRLMQMLQSGDDGPLHAVITELNGHIAPFTDMPCPVIAAVEGACVGAGLELALAADLRVAGESAVFALPETQVGLAPDVGGARRLHAIIGRSRTLDMVSTCRKIDAIEALAWGLIDRRVPDGAVLDHALALASDTRVAAPIALRATLAYVRGLDNLDAENVRSAELTAGVTALRGGEAMEGAMAFMQRRPPNWVADE